MGGLLEVSQEGTPRVTGSNGEGEGIFGHSEIDCPRDSEVDKREELKHLVGPPARLEE